LLSRSLCGITFANGRIRPWTCGRLWVRRRLFNYVCQTGGKCEQRLNGLLRHWYRTLDNAQRRSGRVGRNHRMDSGENGAE
jgi:hypothetical protein